MRTLVVLGLACCTIFVFGACKRDDDEKVVEKLKKLSAEYAEEKAKYTYQLMQNFSSIDSDFSRDLEIVESQIEKLAPLLEEFKQEVREEYSEFEDAKSRFKSGQILRLDYDEAQYSTNIELGRIGIRHLARIKADVLVPHQIQAFDQRTAKNALWYVDTHPNPILWPCLLSSELGVPESRFRKLALTTDRAAKELDNDLGEIRKKFAEFEASLLKSMTDGLPKNVSRRIEDLFGGDFQKLGQALQDPNFDLAAYHLLPKKELDTKQLQDRLNRLPQSLARSKFSILESSLTDKPRVVLDLTEEQLEHIRSAKAEFDREIELVNKMLEVKSIDVTNGKMSRADFDKLFEEASSKEPELELSFVANAASCLSTNQIAKVENKSLEFVARGAVRNRQIPLEGVYLLVASMGLSEVDKAKLATRTKELDEQFDREVVETRKRIDEAREAACSKITKTLTGEENVELTGLLGCSFVESVRRNYRRVPKSPGTE